MTQIRLTLIQSTYRISLEQRELRFSFPRSIPPTELPTDGSVGDVLTWNGSVWEAGAPGSGANLKVWPAGENLSAGKLVLIDGGEAVYFQPSTSAHAGRAYGITKTSATLGANVTVQIAGEISDPGFSFSGLTALYATANGGITHTRPTSGMIQHIGFATGSNSLKIEFWPTIQ